MLQARLEPCFCPELHLLANACQVIVGLQRPDAVQETLARLQHVASRIDSTNLSPLPLQLCREMIIQTFLHLGQLEIRRDPDWARRVRAALIAETPLSGAVCDLVAQLPPLARQAHRLTAPLLDAIQQRHAERGLREADVARALNVSPNTIGRVLRRAGTTFRSAVREARLRHASELLGHRDMSLKQIAWLVGYWDSSQLSRDFARTRGCCPSDYRRACLQRPPDGVRLGTEDPELQCDAPRTPAARRSRPARIP